jgi:DNA-directed RNA polymerase subunit K/omega
MRVPSAAPGAPGGIVNKYEMVLIAAREARRLNDVAKLSARELKIRPTTLAWDRLVKGRIKYTYEAPEEEPRVEEGA